MAQHRDGHEFPVSFTAAPIRKDGEIIGLTGACRDVTERKNAEESLRTRTRELESLTAIANTLAGHGGFREKATHVLSELIRVVQGDEAILMKPDENGTSMRVVAAAGPELLNAEPPTIVTLQRHRLGRRVPQRRARHIEQLPSGFQRLRRHLHTWNAIHRFVTHYLRGPNFRDRQCVIEGGRPFHR